MPGATSSFLLLVVRCLLVAMHLVVESQSDDVVGSILSHPRVLFEWHGLSTMPRPDA